MGARGHLMENRSELVGSSGHSSAHIFRGKYPLPCQQAAAWWSRSLQTFQNFFFFHLNSQFLLEFQESRVLCPTVCVEKGLWKNWGLFLSAIKIHLACKCLMLEGPQEHEISVEEEEHTPGWCRHFTRSSTKWWVHTWVHFSHPHLSCTQSWMPPVSGEGGKQQLFTLTFTPVVNSVHLMCAFELEEEADVQTGRIKKLHTARVWKLNF